MEPVHIETMTAQDATQLMRACGLKMTPETLRAGIYQGQYPFGTTVLNGDGSIANCTIYTVLLKKWLEERAGGAAS